MQTWEEKQKNEGNKSKKQNGKLRSNALFGKLKENPIKKG